MFFNKKKEQKELSKAEIEHLHNALRCVVEYEKRGKQKVLDTVYTEVCWAIVDAGFELTEDEMKNFADRRFK